VAKFVEFFYDGKVYAMPNGTRMFCVGGKTYFENHGKRITDIDNYKIAKPIHSKVGLPLTRQGAEIINSYKVVGGYISGLKRLNAMQFDYEIGRSISLCAFFKPEESMYDENLVEQITRAMPFFNNIFRQPVIHLREDYIVQDVDAVKRVDRHTVKELFKHPRHWKDVEDGVVVPNRLHTKVYDDDYCIYENRIFKCVVDMMLSFLGNRIRSLSSVIMALNQRTELDPINGLNHIGYFSAIGKLYAGFINNTEAINFINELYKRSAKPYKELFSHTNSRVYKMNRKTRSISGTVNKTNIFTMHKDYKHVYRIWDLLSKNKESDANLHDIQMQSQTHYEKYCQALALFSSNYFSFARKPEDIVLTKGHVHATLVYHDWVLRIDIEPLPSINVNAVKLEMTNQGLTKSVLLIPISYHFGTEKQPYYEHVLKKLHVQGHHFDKYVFLEPFLYDEPEHYDYSRMIWLNEKTRLEYGILPISISDINSFQRIQKVVFEQMVYTMQKDATRFCPTTLAPIVISTCAFCGNELGQTVNGFACSRCKLVYEEHTCKNCSTPFRATFIDRSVDINKDRNIEYINTLPRFYRDEKLYMYRNTTDLTDIGVKCPNCKFEN